MTEQVVNLGRCLDVVHTALRNRHRRTQTCRGALRTVAMSFHLEPEGPEVGYIEALMQDALDARAVVAVDQPGAVDDWLMLREAMTELKNAYDADHPEPTR